MFSTLISVIIPVYNAEKYIEKCVCSILEQKFTSFELILVDDGSNDHSLEICKTLGTSDKRIIIVEKSNGGASSARNAGLNVAHGKYIVFVDSDDFVGDTYLLNLYSSVLENDYDIVQCDMKTMKNESSKIPSVVFNKKDILEITKEEALNGYHYKVAIWGKIYKSSLFDEFRFDENIIYEDDDSYYQLAYKAERIAILKETLYYYFMSNNSVMRNNKNTKSTAFIKIYEKRKTFFSNKGEILFLKGTIKRYCLVLCLSYSYFKKCKSNKSDLRRMLELFKSNYKEIKGSHIISLKEKIIFAFFNSFPNLTSLLLGIIR